MDTGTPTNSSPLASAPSTGKHAATVVRTLLERLPADAVWAAMLIAAGCYWGGYQVSDNLILLYGIWMLANRKEYWRRWTALLIFTGIGLLAAHRFDMDIVPVWLQGHLLPLMFILVLQWGLRMERVQAANRAIVASFARIKLHWIPYTLLAVSLTVLVSGLHWSVYGGVMLLIVLLVAIPRNRWLVGGLVMALLYDLVVHLFMLKGALLLQEDLWGFMGAHWDTMLLPVLALLGACMTMPSADQKN